MTETPLYFCMRVPEFAAQALVRLRPTLAKSAAAVLEGDPPLERCCAMTLQARRLGVRHGMTRSELEGIPGLALLRRSDAEERSAALALHDMGARFTPRMQELPRTTAFTLALDMTGTRRLLGTPQGIGQKLFRAARELGFFVRSAASCNLQTAACLLRAPGDALIVVPPGSEQAWMASSPLSALDLTPELLDTFAAWGLRNAGDLAALAPQELVARVGQQGHRLHRLAKGAEEHLLVPSEPVLALEEHIAFDAPVENLESLLFLLSPMLDQLIGRARNRALLLAAITVRLHLERPADQTDRDQGREPETAPDPDDPVHERTLSPALPVDDRALLLKLLQLDLQAHPAPAAVSALTVLATPGPRPGVQAGLFSPQSPEPMRLEVTLARIAALVGEQRVGRATLDDAHATQSFHLERFTVQEESGARRLRPKDPVPPRLVAERTGVALRRLRPPPAVSVTHADGRPHTLRLAAPSLPQRLQVHRAFGPWRRSGQWWSGEVWSQDEWDIDAEAPDGSRLLALLTNDRLRQHWQLEALYD